MSHARMGFLASVPLQENSTRQSCQPSDGVDDVPYHAHNEYEATIIEGGWVSGERD